MSQLEELRAEAANKPPLNGELDAVEDQVWALQDRLFAVEFALIAVIETLMQIDDREARRILLCRLRKQRDCFAAVRGSPPAAIELLDSLLAHAERAEPAD